MDYHSLAAIDVCPKPVLHHTISVHYGDVIMGAIASQITNLTIIYSTANSDADQRKHQSSASLAFVRGIHRGPVNSPRKRPVTRKRFPFDDVIMWSSRYVLRLKRNLTSLDKIMMFTETRRTTYVIMMVAGVVMLQQANSNHRGYDKSRWSYYLITMMSRERYEVSNHRIFDSLFNSLS